jgi:acid phosphatase
MVNSFMKFGRLKSSLPIYNQSPQFLQSDDSEKPQGTFVISSMWFCLIGYAMFLLCECRAELFNLTSWQFWVMKASAPPLEPMLSLYTELRALNWSLALITGRSENQRDLTEQNLLAAGYEGWAALILRSEENEGVPAVEYKTKERLKLEEKGFRIWSGFGDQWSDLTGSASGSRTFKLPNPMYYIY